MSSRFRRTFSARDTMVSEWWVQPLKSNILETCK